MKNMPALLFQYRPSLSSCSRLNQILYQVPLLNVFQVLTGTLVSTYQCGLLPSLQTDALKTPCVVSYAGPNLYGTMFFHQQQPHLSPLVLRDFWHLGLLARTGHLCGERYIGTCLWGILYIFCRVAFSLSIS